MRRQRSASPEGHQQQYHHHNRHLQQRQQHRSSPPRRPPYNHRRRREDVPYNIPSAAPRLHVPHDLPVDVTAFLDLVAFYVVRGGPTTEEEIMKREENNTHFAFLRAPWNDPMQVYYRWRIYSMLQGDTLLKWRTEPYQIERGNEAYVWVPPPATPSGPECLLNAFAADSAGERGREVMPPDATGGDVATASASSSSSLQPVPSALWLSRMSVSEGAFFITLDKQAVEEWQQLLRMEDVVAEASAATGTQGLEDRVTAIAAVLLDSGRIARNMVFAVEHQKAALHLMSLALDEVLQLAYDAARSLRVALGGGGGGVCAGDTGGVGAKSSGGSCCTSVDTALNAVVRCCMCLSHLFTLNDIGKNGGAVPLSEEEVASIALSQDGQCGGISSSGTTTGSGGGGSGSGNNVTNMTTSVCGGMDAPFSASSSLLAPPPLPLPNPSCLPSSSSSSSTTTTTAAAATTTTSGTRLLNRALEKIMPTLIEATLVLALCTVQQYGSLQVDNARETSRSSAKPPGAEETEGILPLDIEHAAYVHIQAKLSGSRGTTPGGSAASMASAPPTSTTTGSLASSSSSSASPSTASTATNLKKEDRDAVCMIAMLLMSWMKQLCASWADEELIGSRCWSTLLTKYAYLLSQPIETT